MVSGQDPRSHASARETISACLRGAGVEIWPPGRWKRERKAKPAIAVITGSDAAKPALPGFADPLIPTPTPTLLREHVRKKRGWYRTQPEDQPQQTPFRVVQLLGRAGRRAHHVGTLWQPYQQPAGKRGRVPYPLAAALGLGASHFIGHMPSEW
jgi:hypothetical protein